jgi:hypothetical protein
MIAPRIAIDNATKVKNIVLMGVVAQNLRDLQFFQIVSTPLLYAEKVLDHNHDGLLSLSEASKDPVFSAMVGNLTLLLETTNGTKHQFNTNRDVYISINNELKPKLITQFDSLSVVTPGKKCDSKYGCPIWLKSHYALEPTLGIIGNVSSATSILMLNGENDSQTPVQQAFLLQQRLTNVNHPDHMLITYPNLGHFFYPSSQWFTRPGPIEPYVLADLYAWLEAHSGLSYPYIATPTSTLAANTSSSSFR